MPRGIKQYVKRQKEQVIEAIEQAEANRWLRGAEVHFSERMSTQLCVDLLAHGLMAIGEGGYAYRICTTPEAKVAEFLQKAKAEM